MLSYDDFYDKMRDGIVYDRVAMEKMFSNHSWEHDFMALPAEDTSHRVARCVLRGEDREQFMLAPIAARSHLAPSQR
jgi:hypothetical protein